MTRPIIRSIIRPIIRGIKRSNSTQLFRSDLQNTLIAQRAFGSATPTYTRATSATVGDFEGIIHTALAGEARFKGSRRVHNLITASEDMTNGAYSDNGGAISSATQTVFDGTNNGQVQQSVALVDDGGGVGSRTFVFSAKIKLVSGTISSDAALNIALEGSSFAGTIVDIGGQVTTTAKRFVVAASTDAAGTQAKPFVRWDDAGTLEITEWQLEETTGQAFPTIPAEYVSSGVGTGVEIWSAPTTLGAGWTDNGDGSYAANVTGDAAMLLSTTEVVDQGTYQFEFKVRDYVSGVMDIGAYGVDLKYVQQNIGGADGAYTYVGTVDAATGHASFELEFKGSPDYVATIYDLSVKKADHGANVDAVQYFKTLNGNTASSNVVTEATGALIAITELVLNGSEFTNTNDWIDENGNVTAAASGGQIEVTNNGAGSVYQIIPSVVGREYNFSGDFVTKSGGGRLRVGTSIGSQAYAFSSSAGTLTSTFTATTTTIFISLLDSAGGSGVVNVYDNLSIKDNFYYADAKGPYGYMSEAAATNIGLHSSAYENAHWTQDGATPSDNNAVSPTGATTASLITLTNTTNRHRLAAASVGSSGVASFTAYMKAGTVSWASISNGSTGQGWAKFNISTGALGATGGTEFVSSNIESLPNGWYRIELVLTLTAAVVANLAIADTEANVTDATSTWLAAGTETAYWFGFQLEKNSFPTSYNATTTTAVTRNADVLTYDDVGNISDTAGTAVCEASTDWSTASAISYALARTSSGGILFTGAQSSAIARSTDGTSTSQAPTGTARLNSPQPTAASWGSVLTAYSSGTLLPDLSPASYVGTMGTGDIGIACLNTGASQWGGTNRLVKIFSNEKSDAEVLLLG